MKIRIQAALSGILLMNISCLARGYTSTSEGNEAQTNNSEASAALDKIVCHDGIGSTITIELSGSTTRVGNDNDVKMATAEVSGPALDTGKFPWAKVERVWIFSDGRIDLDYSHARSDLHLIGRRENGGVTFKTQYGVEQWRFQNCDM
jgi:hypothetical protein